MLGFGKTEADSAPRVSSRMCSDHFSGKYPHVGIYDCRERKVWVCKPLSGQAIRTSHAAHITGSSNATSTAWKDRFLCFWFYTPKTGEGYILGYPIDWDEAHLLVRIDPQWDYDRQRLIAAELSDQIEENLGRQFRHGERIVDFFRKSKLTYPFNVHFIAQRAADSQFYARRIDPAPS
jgi:hypothetical protein